MVASFCHIICLKEVSMGRVHNSLTAAQIIDDNRFPSTRGYWDELQIGNLLKDAAILSYLLE